MIVRAVLTFHGIDERGGPLSFPPRLFDELLKALARNALPIVDLDALLAPATQHGVALTFDDGLRSVYAAALPILRDHGAPAHLFLSTGMVGDQNANLRPMRSEALTWDAVEQLHASGVAIESHTHRHADLRMLRDDDIETECAIADTLIERRLGRRPRYFAYPFGRHDPRVCARVAARYAAAFTTSLDFLSPRDERARLPRVDAYYLRPSLVHRHPAAPTTRAYLRLRKMLRLIRGTE